MWTVYPARINCNLKSKTIEEIKGHRQKEILAMLPYLKGALQRDMPVFAEALAADFKEKGAGRHGLSRASSAAERLGRQHVVLRRRCGHR